MEKNEPVYALTRRIDRRIETSICGKSLEPGWYRWNYRLSGESVHPQFQYSVNNHTWIDCSSLFEDGSEFRDTLDKESTIGIEKMKYVETIEYKGRLVPVFLDDYGQCFYAIYDNKEIVFGSWQDNYLDEIVSMIEDDLKIVNKF